MYVYVCVHVYVCVLDLVIRSHEVKQEGYEVSHNGKCITVFSAPNYWYVWGGGGAGGVARPCGIVGLYVVTRWTTKLPSSLLPKTCSPASPHSQQW